MNINVRVCMCLCVCVWQVEQQALIYLHVQQDLKV